MGLTEQLIIGGNQGMILLSQRRHQAFQQGELAAEPWQLARVNLPPYGFEQRPIGGMRFNGVNDRAGVEVYGTGSWQGQ